MRGTLPILLAILCAVCLVKPLEASETAGPSAGSLVTDSTKSVIEVGLRYNGDRIAFFGTLAGTEADALIVKLTSPAETVKINLKGRVGPVWMNTRQYEVENVPSMYQIQASAPLDKITTPELASPCSPDWRTTFSATLPVSPALVTRLCVSIIIRLPSVYS